MIFYDIFGKKEKKKSSIKEKPKEKILVDYRERNSLVASELVALNLDVEFRELKVADYLVKDVAIERKTVSDFISSMINKRLIKQLEELKQYEKKLILIEGLDENELYNEDKEGMNSNAIRGFLLSITLKHKIPIIFTKDAQDTARYIYLIAIKKTDNELSLNVMKKSLNPKEQKQFILEGFQGIGPKTARKILEKYQSLQEVFNAPEEELKEILGKKAEIFKRTIEEKY